MTTHAAALGSTCRRCGCGRRAVRWAVILAMALAAGFRLAAAEPAERPVLTNIDRVWAMSAAERAQEHPLRLEGWVNFIDPMWGNLWFETAEGVFYARLADDPPALRAGRAFRLEGTLVPEEGLSARRLELEVGEAGPGAPPLETAGRINDLERFDKRRVTVEGVVDVQQLVDAEHLRVMLIVENRPVVCWLRPRNPAALPDYRGQVVAVTGVFSGRIDPTGNQSTIEIWVADEADVAVRGPVAELPVFGAATLALARLGGVPTGTAVVVEGVVEERRPGEGILLRDAGGEIWVRSIQEEVFGRGTPVMVAGRVLAEQARRVLAEAIIRGADAGRAAHLREQLERAPGRVERLREMSPAEAGEGRELVLLGTVTWSHPGLDFFYLADLSGGTRVRFDPRRFTPPPFYQYLRLTGRTVAGPAGPEVEMAAMENLGVRGHPKPLPITVADAMAGGVEAQWVEMRGFLQRVESGGDWRQFHLTSPTGDFTGVLNSPVNLEAPQGSLLRIRGVLETRRGEAGEIEAVQLRIPFLHDIHVEEIAPADPFELPLRPLGNLERLSVLEDMIQVRVRGRLVHLCAEGAVILQDGENGLEVFSAGIGTWANGSLIEAVGILGREGPRVVLREAVLREVGAGAEIPPVPVAAAALNNRRWDTRLVRVTGTVLSRTDGPAGMRLILESGGIGWDAWLSGSHGRLPRGMAAPGSVVEVGGVCRFTYDLQHRPLGFEIELREPDDLVVRSRPAWLTGRRAMVLLGGLATVAALATLTVLGLRRRVTAQTRQIRQQLERQAALEAELERDHRFRALGALAGGIAHDFNNLLTVIIGNLSLLRIDERVMAAAGEPVEEAARTADRAKALIGQLVTLARGGAPVTRPLDLGSWLERVVTAALPRGWKLELKRAEEAIPVQVDEDQLARAVQTLVRHLTGREPRVGRLRLKLVSDEARRHVNVELGDDGPTPPAGQLESMFDPYGESLYGEERFSMALANSIVRRHGGLLTVAAERGLMFRCTLPRDRAAVVRPTGPDPTPVPPPAAAGAPSAPAAAGIAASRRVLVLEDEPTVARVVQRFLERLGYAATLTVEGRACVEAYAAAMREGRPYAVVVLDLTVPQGMGGAETVTKLHAIDPAVCAVASSGYSDDPVMAEPEPHGFAAVLRKPYQLDELKRLLERLTGADPAAEPERPR